MPEYAVGDIIEFQMEHSSQSEQAKIVYGPVPDGSWVSYETDNGFIVREYEILRKVV